jgi:hypothetical protein
MKPMHFKEMGREFDNKIKYFFGPSKDLGLICCPKIKEKNEAQRCKKMQEFKTRWHALNQI